MSDFVKENLNTIIKGDCLEVLEQIEDCSIDLIITSPPYNKTFFNGGKRTENTGNSIWKGYNINYDICDDNMPIDEYEEFISNILNECYRVLKKGGSLFFNHKPIRYNNKIYHPMKLILKSGIELYQELIWDRKNSPNIRNDVFLPNTERIYWITKGKPKFNRSKLDKEFQKEIWTIIPDKCNNHPAPFPEKIVDNCIKCCSDKDDIILDPFMGSGTTALACLKRGCHYMGSEISKQQCEYAEKRLREFDCNESLDEDLF